MFRTFLFAHSMEHFLLQAMIPLSISNMTFKINLSFTSYFSSTAFISLFGFSVFIILLFSIFTINIFNSIEYEAILLSLVHHSDEIRYIGKC